VTKPKLLFSRRQSIYDFRITDYVDLTRITQIVFFGKLRLAASHKTLDGFMGLVGYGATEVTTLATLMEIYISRYNLGTIGLR